MSHTAAPGPDDAVIRVSGFVKRFGNRVAVDGLDLVVTAGACVGLLGPNGAGKTTTMRALTSLVRPDAGELLVLGRQLPVDGKRARAAMGVVPQHDNLDPALTVEQNLQLAAHLYRVDAGERRKAIERALRIARLVDHRGDDVDALSGGMRRRLLIARALIHRPRLVLLDEPTVGLDPQLRQELWGLIDGLRSAGVAVLLSTHYIEEAERLCETVTIMSRGRAVASGPPDELVREHAGRDVYDVPGSASYLHVMESHARGRGWRVRRNGTLLSVFGSHDYVDQHAVRRAPTLEDVVVLLTGEEID